MASKTTITISGTMLLHFGHSDLTPLPEAPKPIDSDELECDFTNPLGE